MTIPTDPRVGLNQALRLLIDQTRRLQDAPEAAAAAMAAVEQASAHLHEHVVPVIESQSGLGPGTGMGPDTARRVPAEFFPYSPVIGPLNPLSPPLTLEVQDDGSVTGEVTMGSAYNGPPNSVHGGMIALLMDELLGCTAVVNDLGGFTGTLSVYYRIPTPIGTPLQLSARVGKQERRKSWVAGTIRGDGNLYVEAEGIFIRPRSADDPPPA